MLLLVWALSTYIVIVNRKIILAMFSLVMFFFMLGNIFAYLINDEFSLFSTDLMIVKHVFNSLVIVILTVLLCSYIKMSNYQKNTQTIPYKSNHNTYTIRVFALVGFLITIFFSYVEVYQKVVFVTNNSYISYYLDFTPNIPYIFLVLSSLSSTFFYIFLGTLPNLKKMIFPTLLYIGIGVFSLFFGQRNHLILRILVLLVYYVLYTQSKNMQFRIKIKYIITLIVSLPILIVFLSFWGSYRFNQEFEFNNIIDINLDFISSIGNSVSIIEYGLIYAEKLDSDVYYSLGEIEIFLRNNTISKLIGIQSIPNEPNTVETAIYGRSFSSTLMYYQNNYGYISGYGIGSSYIAEIYHDFSYIGIMIITLIYSMILVNIQKLKSINFLKIAITLSFTYFLFFSFRSTTFSFLTNTFTIPKIMIYIAFYFVGKFVILKKKGY